MQLSSVSELSSFEVLGHVDLSHNGLTYEALAAIRGVHIVHLLLQV